MVKIFFCSLLGILLCGHIGTAECIDWTGLYVGAQVGRGWPSTHWKYLNANPYDANGPGQPVLGTTNNFHRSHVIGGAQLGFNVQFWKIVSGLEAACIGGGFSQRKLNVVQSIFPSSEQIVKNDISPFALGTGRIGFLFLPAWLIYGKGGYAGARVKTSGKTSPSIPGLNLDWHSSKWHSGWVAGGGLEYWISTFLTVGVEYNYISLHKQNHVGHVSGGAIGPGNQIVHSVDPHLQTFMARLNFIIW